MNSQKNITVQATTNNPKKSSLKTQNCNINTHIQNLKKSARAITDCSGFFLNPLLALTAITAPAALADLTQVPGLNGVQSSTAEAVQTLCPMMVGLDLNSDQQALFARCSELVQTSNELQGSTNTPLSLGLSNQELAAALQRIAPEETEIIGAGVTNAAQDRINSLSGRLQVLRTGSTTMPVAGISWTGKSLTGGSAGSMDAERWGMFINGNYGTGNRDASTEEDGFDFDAYGLTAGLDYRFSDVLVAGVALGASRSEVDMDDNFGDYDTDGYSLSLYGTYYWQNFYLEGSLTYGIYEYSGQRRIIYASNSAVAGTSQRVDTDTDGDQTSYSFAVGYNGYMDQWNYHFFGRVEGVDADVDSYNETGTELAMRVDNQNIESVQLALGAHMAYAFSQSFGVITPYFSVEQRHETDDEERSIKARYIFDPNNIDLVFKTERADEDFSVLSAGANFVMHSGNQFFINYEAPIDLDNVESHTVVLGLRFEM